MGARVNVWAGPRGELLQLGFFRWETGVYPHERTAEALRRCGEITKKERESDDFGALGKLCSLWCMNFSQGLFALSRVTVLVDLKVLWFLLYHFFRTMQ